MYIARVTWFICLVTIGDGYSAKNALEASIREQQVNLDDQEVNTFMNNDRRRGGDIAADDSEEEKKLRLWNILKGMKFGNNIDLLPECGNPKVIFSCFSYPQQFLDFMKSKQGDVRKLGSFPTSQIKKINYPSTTPNIRLESSKLSAYAAEFTDPLWNKQFYMQDYRTTDLPVMDMNVVPVYKKGITGKGVSIAVLDSGVDVTHEDLRENILMDLNFDYCHNKPGCPMMKRPNMDSVFDSDHGTQVAGIIAMIANNGKAGVGIAHNAKFAGVRLSCDSQDILAELYPPTGEDPESELEYTFSLLTAKGLTHRLDVFDIYQNSWGPDDSPLEMELVHQLEDKALIEGISKGRNGKGAIYTFASGNGKKKGDNCAYDGIINHIATIVVAAVAADGTPTYYSERCTAIYTTAYGGSTLRTEGIVAPLKNNKASNAFFGTSAATPLISGIIALALEAKPELTYRDVMHLIVRSSEVAPLANNRNTWQKNAAGFWVSMDFGFGLLNAERMVSLAKEWTTVPEKSTCTMTVKPPRRTTLYVSKPVFISFNTNECYGFNRPEIYYLEQVEVIPYIKYQARGAISLYLTSPKGTTVTIMEGRSRDVATNGFSGHSIKSVHYWGENPKGEWKIKITTSLMWRKPKAIWSKPNEVEKFEVKLHGTYHQPKNALRTYDSFRLPNGFEQH